MSKPLLDDDRVESLRQDSIYERIIVGSDIRALIADLRYYKALAEERGNALEEAKKYLESSPTWNQKKYRVYDKIELALGKDKP